MTNTNPDFVRQPLDYMRTIYLTQQMVARGYDPDYALRICLSGEDIDDCFIICNACNSVFDIYLKECCDKGIPYLHFIDFRVIRDAIYAAFPDQVPEKRHQMFREIVEYHKLKDKLSPEQLQALNQAVVDPSALPASARERDIRLTPWEKKLNGHLHDRFQTKEYSESLHTARNNSQLTATVAKPLVIHGLMDKDTVCSGDFIKILIEGLKEAGNYTKGLNVDAIQADFRNGLKFITPMKK